MNIFLIIKGFFKNTNIEDESENDGNEFETLTPKLIDDDKAKVYFKALDFAFSRADVRNIAVTGPYGSGKSTTILSYLHLHKIIKYINVSLADFDISDNKSQPATKEVELSILQQILYKENRNALPDSRIDRIQLKNSMYINGVFYSTLKIIFPLLLSIGLLFDDTTIKYLNLPIDFLVFFKEHYWIRIGLVALSSLIAIYSILDCASRIGIFDKKIKLNKIAFFKGDVETTSQESPSLLNNCLDEIVYFFSASGYRVVVFEDLDRLGNTEILIKLREINKIVNNNLQEHDSVRFVYAVRDDIFLGADVRTKFFDFIVPIIPVMDARNSYAILKNKLKNFPESKDVCLRNTSIYINDLRCLQNITNEYNIFRKIVDNKSDEGKLYSLVFYKNIYAQDYNLIDKKCGVLYNFIKEYRNKMLHEEYFLDLGRKLVELNERLENQNNEKLSTPEDIRRELILRFISQELWNNVLFMIESNVNYSRNYNNYSAQNVYDDENLFIKLFGDNTNLYIGYNSNNQWIRIAIDNGKKNLIIDEYKKRSELVLDSRENAYQQTLANLEITKEEIRNRNAISLAELTKMIGPKRFAEIAESYLAGIDDPDIINGEQLNTIRSNFRYGGLDALYFLLANGYLMQDFMMYRSIFHEGGISVNDNDFIKSIGLDLSCAAANRDYAVDNEKMVITDLASQNFIYRDGAMHHQLIEYMIDNHSEYLNEMISSIFNKAGSEIISIFDVLADKFSRQDYFRNLILIALDKNGYLDRMISVLDENGSGDIQTRIAVNMISLVSPNKSRLKEKYRDYIIKCGCRLVSYLDNNISIKFLNNIKALEVWYDEIINPVSSVEYDAIEYIAENNMYRLSRGNFRVIVSVLLRNNHVTAEQVDERPLSLIKDNNLGFVQKFVDRNIDTFVFEIFLSSQEDSETIVEILKHPSLSDELKVAIVKEMSFIVSDPHAIPVNIDVGPEQLSFHDLFYRHDRVEPGWEALNNYICEDCNLDVLTRYIDRHADSLRDLDAGLVDGERYDLLFCKVICNDKLSDSTYSAILSSVYFNVHCIDERLSVNNFLRLIKNKKIVLDSESFDKVTEHFIPLTEEGSKEAFVIWFSQYKDEFLRDPNHYLRFEMQNKKFFTDILREIIESENFSTEEKAELMKRYYLPNDGDFRKSLNISRDVIFNVIKSSNDDALKMHMIIKLMNNRSTRKTDIESLVEYLSEKEFMKIFTYKNQATLNISNTEGTKEFLAALRKRLVNSPCRLTQTG